MNRSVTRKQKLRSTTQQTKRLIIRKRQEYLAKIENSFSVNPKLFWSYHKAILRPKANLHHEITFNEITAKSAKDKATLFNAYFSSVFRSPTTYSKSGVCEPLHLSEVEELSNITLDPEVARTLYYLDTSKACGPDGIPTRLLQECSFQIAPSICDLFNHSLHTGQIPTEWKSANVTPVHKKDRKEPAKYYRPISLLPILGKVLERSVRFRLYDHVKHFISKLQHGFPRQRSCVTQLLPVLHTIGQDLDNKPTSVDRNILLHKLKLCGVRTTTCMV